MELSTTGGKRRSSTNMFCTEHEGWCVQGRGVVCGTRYRRGGVCDLAWVGYVISLGRVFSSRCSALNE